MAVKEETKPSIKISVDSEAVFGVFALKHDMACDLFSEL